MKNNSEVALLIPLNVKPSDLELARRDEGPRKDYFELATKLDADIVDLARVANGKQRSPRLVSRFAGSSLGLAWWAFLHRDVVSTFYSESERVGIPLAILLKVVGARNRHVMIGHYLSPKKKRLLLRSLRLGPQINWVICHSHAQQRAAEAAGLSPEQVAFVPYGVDQHFWHPLPLPEEDLICAVGMERRDYPTLVEAMLSTPKQLIIAAASPWFGSAGFTSGRPLPPWIQVSRFDYPHLRELYARSRFVVVPLVDLDFQAGITTVLEAMAMGKAVIASRTSGLAATGVIRDGETGVFVEPGNPEALRQAIDDLWENPAKAQAMGRLGRKLVEEQFSIDTFTGRVAELVSGRPEAESRGMVNLPLT